MSEEELVERPPADRVHLPAAQPVRLAHRDAERPHGPAAEAAAGGPGRRRHASCSTYLLLGDLDLQGEPQKPKLDYKPAEPLRRAAAAGRDRPGAGQPAEAGAGRRADRGARRQHRPRGRHAVAAPRPRRGPSRPAAARPPARRGRRGRPAAEWQVPLLKQIATETGTTSLIVTHDTRIMNLADRIVHMERGRIESNVVVAERLFVREGLRQCAGRSRRSCPRSSRRSPTRCWSASTRTSRCGRTTWHAHPGRAGGVRSPARRSSGRATR